MLKEQYIQQLVKRKLKGYFITLAKYRHFNPVEVIKLEHLTIVLGEEKYSPSANTYYFSRQFTKQQLLKAIDFAIKLNERFKTKEILTVCYDLQDEEKRVLELERGAYLTIGELAEYAKGEMYSLCETTVEELDLLNIYSRGDDLLLY